MRVLRPERERCVLAVAAKLLSLKARAEPLRLAILARADESGFSPASFSSWRLGALWGPSEARARAALEDVRELLEHLCRLYAVPRFPMPPAFLEGPALSAPWRPALARAVPLAEPEPGVLEYFLRRIFGREAFRPGQREAALRLLAGSDVFLVLPTGSGKSLAYQLAALLRPGVCLALMPTLSLIDDQRRALAASGVGRTLAVVSGVSAAARRGRLKRLLEGWAHFCYLTPERLQTPSFRRVLARLAKGPGICLAAIDEAHCVSEWGHDFRPAYLHVARVLSTWAEAGGRVPRIALTATASKRVLRETRRDLGLRPRTALIARARSRVELRLRLWRCAPEKKREALSALLKRLPSEFGEEEDAFYRLRGPSSRCGILFCPHVEGPFGARALARFLAERGIPAGVYHGKPPRGVEARLWERERRVQARRFLADEVLWMAATKAFGMGIDKPNVRCSVHLGLPPSLEAFYQEAGRCGRDGAPAQCWILLSVQDTARALRLLDPGTPHAEVAAELGAPGGRREEDDVTRALRMHLRAFPGEEAELDDMRQVLFRLGSLDRPRWARLELPTQHEPLVERALHRLFCLGVVADYAAVGGEGEFQVRLSGAGPGEIAESLGASLRAGCASPWESALARLRREWRRPRREWRRPWREWRRPRREADLAAAVEAGGRLLVRCVYGCVEPSRREAMLRLYEACLPWEREEALRAKVEAYFRIEEGDVPRENGSRLGALLQQSREGAGIEALAAGGPCAAERAPGG